MSGSTNYRLLKLLVPASFVLGAGMELFMVKVPIGGKTFYDVAKEKKEERLREALLEEEEFRERREERRRRLEKLYGSKLSEESK